jgi:hypothetical protein
MKRFGQEVFNFTNEQLWGPSEARNAPDVRFAEDYEPFRTYNDAWDASFHRLLRGARAFVETNRLSHITGKSVGDIQLSIQAWYHKYKYEAGEVSPRTMLQHFGTEWGRNLHSTIWVDVFVHIASELLGDDYKVYYPDHGVHLVPEDMVPNPTRIVVNTDLRFTNELENLRNAGAYLIQVKRPVTDRMAEVVGIPNHPSEAEQKQFTDSMFDSVIMNTGTLEDLAAEVSRVASNF